MFDNVIQILALQGCPEVNLLQLNLTQQFDLQVQM